MGTPLWHALLEEAGTASEVIAPADEDFARLPATQRKALPPLPQQITGPVDLTVYAMVLLRMPSWDPQIMHTSHAACAFLGDAAQRLSVLAAMLDPPQGKLQDRSEIA